MTRLANQEKAGYFPLPTTIGEQIATYFQAPDGGRLYDPCAGCGRALAQLAGHHELEPYGVELDARRAAEADQVIQSLLAARPSPEIYPAHKRLVPGSFRAMKVAKAAFNLLYLNPPYLFSDELDANQKEFGRDEYLWLKETRPYLQPEGLFIWVVPQHMLLHNQAVRYIAAWFEGVQVHRFPDPEYARFRQVVVFGRLRRRKLTPTAEAIADLRECGRLGEQLAPLTAVAQPMYTLPPLALPPAQMIFRSIYVDPQEAMAEAERQGVVTGEDFAIHLQAKANDSHRLRPLTPMKKGHLVSVIAAGLLNGTVLDDGQTRLMIKGQAYKTKVVAEKTETTESGRTTTITRTEKVVTRITALTADGEIKALTGAALQQFLSHWLDTLTAKVVTDYPPLYPFDLNGYGPFIRHLNPYRQIPRVGKPGLLPAQAHAVAAAAMRLERENDAYIIGEMGTGKTLMGIAVPAVLHAKSRGRQMNHIIVMCPPHLVKKWEREIKHVWPAVKTTVLATISDVDCFFAQPGPIVGIMKETSGRMATGWTHAYDACGPTIAKQRRGKQKVKRLRQSIFWQPARRLREEKGVDVSEAKLELYRQLRGISCPACGCRPESNGVPLMATDFSRRQLTCDQCGGALYQATRRSGDSNSLTGGSFRTYWQRERRRPAEPPQNEGYARFPLATYINKKYKGRLDLLISDEMHQFKGADSDRGYAYHRLCTAAKKVLGLTGTLYGGKASTLFYLLYRSSARIRRHFTDSAAQGKRRLQWKKWVSNYGILQEIEVNHLDQNGQSSGNRKSSVRIKELPGGSPAMLPWILESCVFVSLPDMGFALPDYEEIPVLVEMSPAQRGQYRAFEAELKEALVKRLQVRDKSLLGAYVQSLLTLPDSPWRNKGVFDRNGQPVAFARALPADSLYPKEAAILKLIQERVAQGEKVLLLCQQTSTLDITPHWLHLLAEAGLKAAVLKAAPDRREAWIKKQLRAGLDVLITHPKRVETGLDLLAMPTIIWMGTEYSLYTIQQASRRSWRIGQEKDVKVYYFVYAETMQEQALGLIAAKVGAAARINGDSLPDDGLSEFDEYTGTDLVSTLSSLLQEELNAEEAMKQVNDAYELAQKGKLQAYAHTPFSFAGCRTLESIKKRYRELANRYHPDKAAAGETQAQTVETLTDLFKQANVAFQEDEARMGDFDGPLLAGEVAYEAVTDEVDAVIRKLLLGEEMPAQPASKASRNGAYVEVEEPVTSQADVNQVEGEQNGRLDFATLTYVSKAEKVPVGSPSENGAEAPPEAESVAVTQTNQPPGEDDLIRVDKQLFRHMRQSLLKYKKRVDQVFEVAGRQLVIVERDWDAYAKGTVTAPHIAYQIDFAGDYLHLAAETPAAEQQMCGEHHGRKVKYRGYAYFLYGPPLRILPHGVELEEQDSRPEKPEPEPVESKPKPVERLVFGVHDSAGQVRTVGLDRVTAVQMSLFS